MAGNSTKYTDLQNPPVSAEWLNDINSVNYNLLGDASGNIPTSRSAILTNLGVSGGGSVTTVSVASANGFAGTVATPTSTPVITLSTSVTGVLYGNGTAIGVATNAELPAMSATVGGAVPTPPNNTTTFLRGDGTFATPSGGGTLTESAALTSGNLLIGAGTTVVSPTKVTLTQPATAGTLVFGTDNSTITLQGTDTYVGRATTDSLTNKTYNGLTVSTTTGTFTLTNGKTLSATNTLTLSGTDSTTMTFPPASASIGYLGSPQNSQSTGYTTVLADSGKTILHPSSDANARTFTIDSNANVAFPLGTTITFINDSANNVTLAITSDTLVWVPTGGTGSRTLAQYAVATAIKIGTTRWYVSGVGIT